MEQALPGKGCKEVQGMKHGADLALCKEGGLVDHSCMALASRGNSLRPGAGS